MTEENWLPQVPDAGRVPDAEPDIRDTFEHIFPGWYKLVYEEDDATEPPDILLAELVSLFTEWMFAFKVSDACAKAVYLLLKTILPENANIGQWPQLKRTLEAVTDSTCTEIDICPNDCIAYYDCKHPKLAFYKHAHRTFCSVCGADRYVTHEGVTRSAKRGFYFPLASYLRGLFSSDELRAHLPWDAGNPPAGHTKRSYGWHKKVINNPQMNGDVRNQALVGMSDGIPMFRAKMSRSVVPIALRAANLPASLGIKFRHIHLSGLYPGEFWAIVKGQWKREERKPKTLMPLLYLLTDDLLHWQDGDYVDDTARAEGDAQRRFLLRVCLLFWCGDYPGLGEVSGFIHGIPTNGMCHWCKIVGEHNVETHSRMYAKFWRWLKRGDPLRMGNEEPRPSPREHNETCAQAMQNQDWEGLQKDFPVNFTGVRLFCPLACLYLFDIIWDMMLDYMHTVKGFWEARVIPTMRGDRCPKKRFEADPERNDPEYEGKMEELVQPKARWKTHEKVHKQCTIPSDKAALVDQRIKELCGQQDWIKQTMVQLINIC